MYFLFFRPALQIPLTKSHPTKTTPANQKTSKRKMKIHYQTNQYKKLQNTNKKQIQKNTIRY
jgi:hypothetical protein